ncbi:MAG: DUF2914 domain-containing protein [Deltaproteobacteria bacterium]|nr:MAG: DUF2914 domain-containing protein [Deltaproteobacteria bacterium]
MGFRFGRLFLLLFIGLAASVIACPVGAQNQVPSESPQVDPSAAKPVLSHASMSEKVESLAPVRQAEVFSVSVGQVYCFTSFDPVPQPALIYHRWFHRDELSTQTRLRLYPPKWATYSVIQLRETDKGPWRVEISDQNGHIFYVLRFSIAD